MLAFQFVYILANGLFYGLLLRRMKFFGSERGIFLFQACSFSALVCITAICSLHRLPLTTSGLFILSAVGLHGIYSVSFLELWSLSEGSFSISILNHLDLVNEPVSLLDLEHLGAIAVQKEENRQSALLSLGLIKVAQPDHFVVTTTGYAVAFLFKIVLALSNGRSLNQ